MEMDHQELFPFKRDSNAISSITSYIQDCFQLQIFCDLTLRGSDPSWSVACHRCVLGMVFPNLRAILNAPLDQDVDIILAEFAPDEIAILIETIYNNLNQKQFVIPNQSTELARLLNLKTTTLVKNEENYSEDHDLFTKPDSIFDDYEDFPDMEEDEVLVKVEGLESDSSPPKKQRTRRQKSHDSPLKVKRKRSSTKKDDTLRRKSGPIYPKPINHLDYYNAEKLEALKNSMKCDCPGLTFGNLIEQQNHFYTAHCQRDFSVCETCGNPVRIKYMEAHRETCAGSRKKPCLCPHCGHHTKGSGTLSTHMFDNHMKVKCKICGQEFIGDKSRRKHDHEKHAQTFDCDHCPLQFNTLYKKRSHMVRVHVPDHLRPYVCNECGQGFLYEGKLKRHKMNKHIRARPFSCRCGCDNVAYNDQSTRNQHENRSHPHHPIVLERLKNPTVKHKPGVRKEPGLDQDAWEEPP